MTFKMNTKRNYFDFKKQSNISERFHIQLSSDYCNKTMRISKKQKFQFPKKPFIHEEQIMTQIIYELSYNIYDNTPDDNIQYDQIIDQTQQFYTMNFYDANDKYQISTGVQVQMEQQKLEKTNSFLFIQSYPQVEDQQW